MKVILVFLFCFSYGWAGNNNGNCQTDDGSGLDDADWAVPLLIITQDDKSAKQDLKTVTFTAIEQFDDVIEDYFHVERDGLNLKFTTSDTFPNIQEDAFKINHQYPTVTTSDGEYPYIEKSYDVKCIPDGANSSLTVRFYITDINDAPKVIDQNINIPMPLMPKIDITNYLEQPFMVEDYDLLPKNRKFSFEVDLADNFEVSGTEIVVDKNSWQSEIHIKTKTIVTDDTNIKLTVKDSDTNPQAKSVQLTINKDDQSLDIPQFEKPYYEFDLNLNTRELKPRDVKGITVETTKSDGEISLEGDHPDFYDLKVTNNIFSITVKSDADLSDLSKVDTTQLSLKYKTDYLATTTILIHITKYITKFKETFYKGSYDHETNKIVMDPITLQSDADPEDLSVSIDDDYKDVLTPNFDKTSMTCTITNESPLETTNNIITTNLNVILSGETVASTVIIIYLTSEDSAAKFKNAFYTGKYTLDNKIVLDESISLEGFKDNDVITFKFIEFNSEVNVDCESPWNNCKITVTPDLDLFQKGSVQTLTLEATAGSVVASTGIILYIEDEDDNEIRFSKSAYTGNYTEDNLVNMNEEITLLGKSSDTIDVQLEQYNENLEVKLNPDSGVCEITVKKNIDVNDDSIISSTLIATISNKEIASTEIILFLPLSDENMRFSAQSYNAKYTLDASTLEIEGEPIEILGATPEDIDMKLEEYSQYFDPKYDIDSSTWTISVIDQTQIPEDVLKLKTLVTKLVATDTKTNENAKSVLVISLPEMDFSLKFSKTFYTGIYTVDNKINLDETISLEGFKDNDNIKFNFIGLDSEVNADCESPWDNCQINVTPNLDFQKGSVQTLTLRATAGTAIASTGIILYIEEEDDSEIKFSKSAYTGNYTEDNLVNMNEEITLLGKSSDTIDVQLKQYNENLEVKLNPDSGVCEIFLKKNIDVNDDSIISTTLIATISNKEIASTEIILFLPLSDENMRFSAQSYNAKYTLDASTLEIEGEPIEILGATPEDIDMKLEEYSQYFDPKYDIDSSTWTISVIDQTQIPEDVLKLKTLVTKLVATDTKTNDNAKSVLVISLPEMDFSLKFSKTFYTGIYSVDNKINLDETISLEGFKDNDNIKFNFIGLDSEVNVDCESPWDNCQINVIPNLDFQKGSVQTLTLRATAGTAIASTGIILYIEEEDDSEIKFSKSAYTGNYTEDNLVNMNEEITLLGKSSDTIDVQLKQYNENLEVKLNPDSGVCEIFLKKNIDVNDDSIISTTLIATISNKEIASTEIILFLPLSDENMRFSAQSYNAKYTLDASTLEIEGEPIEILGATPEDIDMKLEEYSQYFDPKYDIDSSTWTISVIDQTQIPEDVLKLKTLVTKLVATDTKTNDNAKSVLVISLPEMDFSLKFSKTFYTGIYSVDNKINLDETISLEGFKDNDNIKFNFIGLDSEVNVDCESPWDNCQINVIPNLDFQKGSVQTLTLRATAGTAIASTGIILYIEEEDDSEIKFSKSAYTGNYTEDNLVNMNEEITLLGKSSDTIDVQLKNYNENLEVKLNPDSGVCEITVKKNIDVNDDSIISTTLVATISNKEIASTEIILFLPLSDENMRFSAQSYNAKYTLDASTLEIEGEPIEILGATPEDIDMKLEEYSQYFDPKYDIDSSTWTISVIDQTQIPEDVLKLKTLVTKLVATDTKTNDNAKSVLVISLPEMDFSLKFSKTFYTGIYSVDNKINLDETISLEGFKDNDNIKFNFIGLDSEVNVDCESPWDNCQINVIPNLDFQKGSVQTLTLRATAGTAIASTGIILYIEEEDDSEIKFSKSAYTGNYTEDNLVTIIMNEEITLLGKSSDTIDVQLKNYNENLEVKLNPDSGVCEITVKKNIDVNDDSIISTTLVATISNKEIASTEIILFLPLSDENMRFSAQSYNAKYTLDASTLEIEGNQIEVVAVDANLKDINIVLEDYSQYFIPNLDDSSSKWIISVNDQIQLPEDVFKLKTLVTKLVATDEVTKENAKSVLVISLPEMDFTSKFTKSYYTGNYTVDNQIIMDDPISLEGVTAADHVTFSFSEFSSQLNANYNPETGICDLNADGALDLEKGSILTLTMSAKISDKSITSTTIILNTPVETDTISFNSVLYEAEYIETESELKINDANTIEIKGADQKNIQIVVKGYEKYFQPNYSDKWIITIIEMLPEDVLKSGTIATKLFATDKNSHQTESAIVISLPTMNSESRFKKSYYTGNYTTDDKIIMDGPDIELELKDNEEAVLTFDEYNDNLNITQKDGICTITVFTPLNIQKGSVLTLTLNARVSGQLIASTGIILYIAMEEDNEIRFSKSAYIGNYTEGNEVNMNEEITLLGKSSETIDFEFMQYNDNLNIEWSKDTGVCKINVIKNIDVSTDSIVSTTLVAEISNSKIASTEIILFLPSTSTIQFSAQSYKARYVLSAPTLEIEESDIEVLGADAQEDIDMKLDDTYSQYFIPSYEPDSKKWIISVNDTNPLPEDVYKLKILVTKLIAIDGVTNGIAKSVIVITLPEFDKDSKFSKSYYTGNYTNENDIIMSQDIVLTGTTTSDDIDFYIDEYNNALKISFDILTSICSITVIDDLPIKKNSIITTTLRAINSNIEIASTTLILSMPTEDSLYFNSPLYKLNYNLNESVLSIDGSIEILGAKSENIELKLEDYNQYFGASYDSDSKEWIFTVDNPIPSTLLKLGALSTKLIATEKDTDNVAQSAVTITLPQVDEDKETLFLKNYYTGNYTNDNKILMHEDIYLRTSENSIEFEFGEYKDQLEIEWDKNSGRCTIKLQENIDIQMNSVLITTLNAVVSKIAVATTAIILYMPTEGPILFSSPLYKAKYPLNATELEIQDNNKIQIIGASSENIEMELKDFGDYFKPHYNTDSERWIIAIVNSIPDDLLQLGILTTELIATELDTKVNVGSGIVITLPELDDNSSVSAFEKSYYSGNYSSKDNKIVMTDEIVLITTLTDGLIFQFENFDDSLSVTYDPQTGVCTVNVTAKIDFGTNLVLTTKLNVIRSNIVVASTAMILHSLQEGSFVFSSLLYHSKLNFTDQTLIIDQTNPINVLGADPESIVITFEDFPQSFTVIYNSTSWIINVENIPTELLKLPEFITTLTAKEKETSTQAQSILLITFPENSNSTGLVFSNNYYMGNYSEQGDGWSVEMNDAISFLNGEFEDIDLTLDSYQDYFAIEEVSTNKYQVTIKKPLEKDILENEPSLVISLTAVVNGLASFATLVIFLPKSQGQYNSSDDCDNDYFVAFLATTIVLSILLVGYITGTVLYYFLKIRKTGVNFTDSEVETKPNFIKNTKPSVSKTDSLAERRPTQRFNFEPLEDELLPGEEIIAIDEEPTIAENAYYEPIEEPLKKSVAFDNIVEEMQIDKVEDEEEIDEPSDQENLDEQEIAESSDKINLNKEEVETTKNITDAVEDEDLSYQTIPNKSIGFNDVIGELKIIDETALSKINSQKGRNSNESDS